MVANTQDLNLSPFLHFVFVRDVRIIFIVPLLNVAPRKWQTNWLLPRSFI